MERAEYTWYRWSSTKVASKEPIHSLDPRKEGGLSPIATRWDWISWMVGTQEDGVLVGGVVSGGCVLWSCLYFMAQEQRDCRVR